LAWLIVLTLSSQFRDTGRRRYTQSEHGQILGVLSDEERASFEHQDATTVRGVLVEEMLCYRSAKRAASEDDNIERSSVRSYRLIGRAHGFLPGITCVAAKNVKAEGCPF